MLGEVVIRTIQWKMGWNDIHLLELRLLAGDALAEQAPTSFSGAVNTYIPATGG